VAGTQEPIYGPSAIHSVANQTETAPYTELKRDDLRWAAMDSTSVETQTFYLMADNGHLGFVQVIYSNIMYSSSLQPGYSLLTYLQRYSNNLPIRHQNILP
jgi:hypothetical protein